jgi:hypothetical protein
MSFDRVFDAWRVAALDLKIVIQSPFILGTSDGKEFKFELLIESFGSNLGTLIFSMSTHSKIDIKTAKEFGYYCSIINLDAYSVYERQHFIDTLNDLGYFGEDSQKPFWYTGQPWT